MKFLALMTGFFVTLIFSVAASAQNVEVVLKDKLDGNLNGYCIDIMGGGQNIDPSQGLQAHTCYSYRGELGTDQIVDTSSLEGGKILLLDFDVCATLANHEVDASVALELCDGSENQQFEMAENGTISPKSAPGMCLAAGKETTFGRNGTSPHQIKSLTLQVCSEDESAYQQWYTRTQEDYNAMHAGD